jgi:hypothetical protein
MQWDVVEVRPEPGWLLEVRFADGLTGTVRFRPDFFTGVFEPLRDPQFFESKTFWRQRGAGVHSIRRYANTSRS